MRLTLTALLALVFLAGCGGGSMASYGGTTTVRGVGQNDLLKLRAGPSLEYAVILGLPDGTRLRRQDCVTELGQRWCRVSLAATPGIHGYVSADYLTAN